MTTVHDNALTGELTRMDCGCVFDTPREGQTVWNDHVTICDMHAGYPDFEDFKRALRTEHEPSCAELITNFNDRFITEMRAGYRTLGNRVPLRGSLLLTSTGAKSGKARTVAVSFQRYREMFIVLGTTGGRDRHPAWYFNIRAHPEVEIEVANHHLRAEAVERTGAQRDHLIAVCALIRPTHAAMFERATRLTRHIPLITLAPADASELPLDDSPFPDAAPWTPPAAS